jgi:2-polyprenyl-3-methyl-5-hydroxy-6-metoxy-1,4-benzoquinol methylase
VSSKVVIDEHRRFYNERWNDFQFANRLKLLRASSILEALASLKVAQPEICDLGCGTGWLTSILGNFGPALGVDLSDVAISQASERYPSARFVAHDILAWNYSCSAYDVVVSQEVLEHMPDQARYLQVVYKLLRPGGYLIVTTPNLNTLNAMPDDQRDTWSNQPEENWLTRRALRLLLEQHFEVVKLTSIIPGYGAKGLYRLINSSKIERLLATIGLRNTCARVTLRLGYGLHILAVARKPPV